MSIKAFDTSSIIKFGGHHCLNLHKVYRLWWQSIKNSVELNGTSWVFSDDIVFDEWHCVDVNTPPIEMGPLLDQSAEALEQMSQADKVATINANRGTKSEYNTSRAIRRDRDYNARTAISSVIALIKIAVKPDSPASALIEAICKAEPDQGTTAHPYLLLRSIEDGLKERYGKDDIPTKNHYQDEFKAATDIKYPEPADRMAVLEPAAAYLLSLNEGPSEAELTSWFVEGTKDANMISAIIDPYTINKSKMVRVGGWRELAADITSLWVHKYHRASTESNSVSIRASAALSNTASSDPTLQCRYCGGTHGYKSCTSPSCNDCKLVFNQNNPRNKHYGFACHKRAEAAGKPQYIPPPIAKQGYSKGKDHRATHNNKRKPSNEQGEREDQRFEKRFKKATDGLIAAFTAKLADAKKTD
jgi:hypothetical protein